MDEIHLCVECKHCADKGFPWYVCEASPDINVVSGKVSYDKCETVRRGNRLCGRYEKTDFVVVEQQKSFLKQIMNWIKNV